MEAVIAASSRIADLLRIRGFLFPQELERDGPIQVRILRPINGAHAAAPRISRNVEIVQLRRARKAAPQVGQWSFANGSSSPTSSIAAQFGQGCSKGFFDVGHRIHAVQRLEAGSWAGSGSASCNRFGRTPGARCE